MACFLCAIVPAHANSPPVFPDQTFFNTYVFQVNESPNSGTLVANITAIDADDDPLEYSLSGNDAGFFQIDRLTGVLRSRFALDPDFGRGTYSNLVVEADDGLDPTTVNVIVVVLDVNDIPPSFTQTSYSASVFEDRELDVPFLTVEALDYDSSSANRRITYSIESGDPFGLFQIETVSGDGQISVASPLDYEMNKTHTLTLRATDSGSPPLHDDVTLTITVQDVNDNAPEFAQAFFTASIAENEQPSTPVVTVTASDVDAGDNGDIRYALVGGTVPFAIDATTGEVTTTASLDREAQSSWALTVEARDRGTPSLSATVQLTVSVTDVNDHVPQWINRPYACTITENRSQKTSCITVQATDGDVTGNTVSYSLSGHSAFVINSATGLVQAISPLDRETEVSVCVCVRVCV